PAEKEGVKPKDIIIEVNGQPVENFFVFKRKLLGLMPGNRIRLVIFRNGETREVSSTLVKKGTK
ncbi:MAG: serine protease, partial [Deltaproteobacteria bacterium]|nr:serine protease [Deltaproteobacteria bacterium]